MRRGPRQRGPHFTQKMKRTKEEDLAMSTMLRRNFTQRRMIAFGLNILVMAVCFPLYYLGFFGSVEGPLNMESIGRGLAGMGVTVAGFQVLLIAVFAGMLTWNWLLNLIAHLTGQRLTCSQGSGEQGFCGKLVERRRDLDGKNWVYACPNGHLRREAHFHPIRKGKLANSLLMASLVAAIMFHFA